MIRIDNTETWGFEHAIRGMRNPMNSWENIDSWFGCAKGDYGKTLSNYCNEFCTVDCEFNIGLNDLNLMKRLFDAGTEHRKYARQIFVSMDITAPLYWWKEFDTYKIGTTANSCSTMHKIHENEFTLYDFSCEHIGDVPNCDPMYCDALEMTIMVLNEARHCYIDTNDKKYWWQMIQLLPSSYNQKRTVTMNYENVFSMIKQRKGHKLDEWNDFVSVLKELPYVKEIMEV